MGEKLRQAKVDKINERRLKLIQKTGSKKSIDRLKAKLVLKQGLVECPMDGCKAMVKGPTPTGRQSKDMKLHLLLHKKDDEEIPANVVEASLAAHNMTAHISVLNDNFRLNPHATEYKPAAETKLDFDTDSEVDDTTNVREYDEKYLSVIENTLKQVYCANVITTSVSFDAAIHDENIPVAALVKEAIDGQIECGVHLGDPCQCAGQCVGCTTSSSIFGIDGHLQHHLLEELCQQCRVGVVAIQRARRRVASGTFSACHEGPNHDGHG